MIRKAFIIGFFAVSISLFPTRVFAQEYVLPYPGFMPGHPLYKVTEFVDRVQEWWSFGNFAKFKHHLSMSDKKLVEAKTLFEYKQYLFGYQALEASDRYFDKAASLLRALEKQITFRNAAAKHIEVLEIVEKEIPETFFWNPEKVTPITLSLKNLIDRSKELRRKALR